MAVQADLDSGPQKITRRAFVAAVPALLAMSGSPVALAQEQTALAAEIGGSLAKSAAGAAGSWAFGQIMSAAGADTTGQAAIMAKLDQINQKLDVLQSTVEQLGRDLRKSLSQLTYDLAASQVQDLIVLNTSLKVRMRQLASSSLQTAEAAKRDVRAYLTGSLQLGMETWHAALCGLNGKTGMIEAWNRDVYAGCGGLFGWEQAVAIQQNWDYLDAQQAMTVSYFVEHLNDSGQRDLVRPTLAQWESNRAEQLVRLRGVARVWDEWPKPSGGTTLRALSFLPKDVLISPGTNRMWHLEIGPEVPQMWYNEDFSRSVLPEAQKREQMRGCGGNLFQGDGDAGVQHEFARRRASYYGRASGNCVPWWTTEWEAVLDLMRKCGGRVGGAGGEPDYFVDAMKSKGFRFPPGKVRLWTFSSRMGSDRHDPEHRFTCFREGEEWLHPAGPDDRAMLLFAKDLNGIETSGYWYA